MKASNLILHLEKKGVSKEVTMVIDNKEYSVDIVSPNPDKLILSGGPLPSVQQGETNSLEDSEKKKVTQEATK